MERSYQSSGGIDAGRLNTLKDNTLNITLIQTYNRESASNLDYAMARFYANTSGRFMSPDPGHVGARLNDSQSWNAYVYAGSDPINNIDPLGLLYEVCGVYLCDRGISDVDFAATYIGNPHKYTVTGDPTALGARGFLIWLEEGVIGNYWHYEIDDGLPRRGFGDDPARSAPDGAGSPALEVPRIPANKVSADPCKAPVTAYSLSATYELSGIGARFGGLFNVPGAVVGYAVGSMFGGGINATWVPSTNQWYFGPALAFSPGVWRGGTGLSLARYQFQDARSAQTTMGGWSGSINFQPTPFTGTTITKSPGSPAVTGYTVGSRVPVAYSGGYGLLN